jgi:hypothetical protein
LKHLVGDEQLVALLTLGDGDRKLDAVVASKRTPHIA